MIVNKTPNKTPSKTPICMSFFGGGTDMESFF